ncbi:MAG TPA: DUF1833 family protein [Terriglobia bacterium]|nr:DUF1833 family protein [Terriglobia bacterium]
MPVSQRFREALNASETDEAVLVCLDISHPDLDDVLHFVNNTENIVRNGRTYYRFPFSIDLPNDDPGISTTATLTISNVMPTDDGEIDQETVLAWRKNIADLRQISGIITVSISVILGSTPDVTEAEFPSLTLDSITADAMTITGQLSMDSIFGEPYCGDSMTPGTTPGIF